MTDFMIQGSAVVSWRNKGFQDGLKAGRSEFVAPKVEGKRRRASWRAYYWRNRETRWAAERARYQQKAAG